MRYITGAVSVMLLIVVVLLAIQNLTGVEVSFLAWAFTIPKILLILLTYLLGMFSGWGLVGLIKKSFR
jgi:uncharacterized integral membrane protein